VAQFNVAVATMNQTSDGAQQNAIKEFDALSKIPAAATRAEYCKALALLFWVSRRKPSRSF